MHHVQGQQVRSLTLCHLREYQIGRIDARIRRQMTPSERASGIRLALPDRVPLDQGEEPERPILLASAHPSQPFGANDEGADELCVLGKEPVDEFDRWPVVAKVIHQDRRIDGVLHLVCV